MTTPSKPRKAKKSTTRKAPTRSRPQPVPDLSDEGLQVSSVASFKTNKATGEPLRLPSGNVCLVTRPGMDKLLTMGVIPDSLMPLAEQAVQKGKGAAAAKNVDVGEMIKDPAQVKEVFQSFDRVTASVVVQPPTLFHMREATAQGSGAQAALAAGEAKAEFEEIPAHQRDEVAQKAGYADADAVVWTDEVDFEDKMFIFQFVVGGTRDLERFRAESGVTLERVQPGEEPAQ